MKRLLIIGPIAALAFTGCGSSSSTNASNSTTNGLQKDAVTLDDFNIAPAATALKAGKVQFQVTNKGKTPHEFVVIDTNKSAAGLGNGKRVPEKGNVGETGNLAPGKSKTLVLNLRKGHYAVICNDPGHYMAGMHKDLEVT